MSKTYVLGTSPSRSPQAPSKNKTRRQLTYNAALFDVAVHQNQHGRPLQAYKRRKGRECRRYIFVSITLVLLWYNSAAGGTALLRGDWRSAYTTSVRRGLGYSQQICIWPTDHCYSLNLFRYLAAFVHEQYGGSVYMTA